MADFFTDITSSALRKGMDGAATRHRIIANNIANVETPGFRRSDVSFESKLRQAMDVPDTKIAQQLVEDSEAEVRVDNLSPVGANGNNVSIDREMADMTKNSLEYETLVRLNSMKGAMIMAAITEGKK